MNFLAILEKNPISAGLISLVLGITYFALTSAYFSTPASTSLTADNQTNSTIEIYSPLGRDILLNIISPTTNITLTLNENSAINAFHQYPKTRVSHQDKIFGDVYSLKLKQGTNNLVIGLPSQNPIEEVAYAQHYRFFDFIILCITLLVPMAVATFYFFSAALTQPMPRLLKVRAISWGYIILGLAIVLRLTYFWDMGSMQFQHDYHAHIEYIEFVAKEFFIPLPHKAWEFPQQPFYYLVNGFIYAALDSLGVTKPSILIAISGVGTLLSCISLLFAYRLTRLLTDNTLVQNLTLCFLCFTPSLIYMSTRINNDSWVASLSIIALYYIVASYRTGFAEKLGYALIFSSLLFLTKLSGMLIELIFIVLIITAFVKDPKAMQRAGLLYAMVGFCVLGYTLFRLYYPAAHAFSLVNSGIWPGQDLRPINLNYFFSFNFQALLNEAQSHIGEKNNSAITRSFFTYQYATMLFGEFDYTYWRNQSYWLFFNMQLLLAISILIPLGWLSFIFTKKNFMQSILSMTAIVSLLLLVKFIFSYPSVSNTDFRYHAPIFFMLAYCFALGIVAIIDRFPQCKKVVTVWLFMLVSLNLSFLLTLISI